MNLTEKTIAVKCSLIPSFLMWLYDLIDSIANYENKAMRLHSAHALIPNQMNEEQNERFWSFPYCNVFHRI